MFEYKLNEKQHRRLKIYEITNEMKINNEHAHCTDAERKINEVAHRALER